MAEKAVTTSDDDIINVIPQLFMLMVFLLLIPAILQGTAMAGQATAMAVSPRVPVLTQALDPIAANVGA
ncbi:unnamed protein product, partial [marine sediment metagenome]